MEISVKTGDVLHEAADVLICSANTQLNMSGGVNGALLQLDDGGIQRELRAYLSQRNQVHVPSGTVVKTGAGPLSVRFILHAVAVDAFYDSSLELVETLLCNAFAIAEEEGARTLVTPALATGYGPLSIETFATALKQAVAKDWRQLERVVLVCSKEHQTQTARSVLAAG